MGEGPRMKLGHEARYFFRDESPRRLEIVRPVLSTFNLVTIRKPHVFPLHQHFNYQLIFIKQGRYRCTINHVPLKLKAGDILVVKPGDWHEDHCLPPLRYCAMNFQLDSGRSGSSHDILFRERIVPASQVLRGSNTELWEVIERMQRESERHDDVVANLENALLLELFWKLVRAIPRDLLSPVFLQRSEAQAFGERLRRLFDDSVETKLTAISVASALGVSVRTLTNRCGEVLGMAPMKAYMHHKMGHAARLIVQSTLPIKDISFRLGFQNPYHFSRVFRRHLGVAPSAYRKMPK